MTEEFDVKVTYNGNIIDAELRIDSQVEEKMGTDIMWDVNIMKDNGEGKKVFTFSEYPLGSFAEIARDPLMTSPLSAFTSIILRDRLAPVNNMRKV